MNLIYALISTFFTNYIIMIVIKYFPVKRKRLWNTILVSLADISPIISYIVVIFSYLFSPQRDGIDFVLLLDYSGSIIGTAIAYVAAMTMIFDNVVFFKSRRLKKFERESKAIDSKSIPKQIVALILFICSLILFGFGVVVIINYSTDLLLSLIGSFTFGAILLALSIYFFISGRGAKEKNISSNSLMLIINLPNKRRIFTAKLSKGFKESDAYGSFAENYFLDDYGILITPNDKYFVKGIKVNNIVDSEIEKLQMEENNSLNISALDEFKRYQKHKIIIDENNEIKKNLTI